MTRYALFAVLFSEGASFGAADPNTTIADGVPVRQRISLVLPNALQEGSAMPLAAVRNDLV